MKTLPSGAPRVYTPPPTATWWVWPWQTSSPCCPRYKQTINSIKYKVYQKIIFASGAPGGALLPHPGRHVGLGQPRVLPHGLCSVPRHERLGALSNRLHHREVHRHLSSHEGPGEILFGIIFLLFELNYTKSLFLCYAFNLYFFGWIFHKLTHTDDAHFIDTDSWCKC